MVNFKLKVNQKHTGKTLTAIPLLWRGGENSERIFDGVVFISEWSMVNFASQMNGEF